DRFNAQIAEANEQVAALLKRVSGQDLPAQPEPWQRWYVDLLGYNLRPEKATAKRTVVEEVPPNFQLPPVAGFEGGPGGSYRIGCFGAGPIVRTFTGDRPIESIRVGDRVLTQDSRTGALSYQPVLVVLHNPPSKTFRVRLGEESVVSSHFHRFW